MTNDEDFIRALDIAAKALLEKAGVSAKVQDGSSSPSCTVAEQVKAFEAVVDWAKTRRDLKPAEKQKSAFDDLKRQFSGETPVGRRNARKPRKAAESGDPSGPAEPDDLFGSEEA